MSGYPNFVGGSYRSRSSVVDCERCINLYVENMESAGAKTRAALYSCPGFTPFLTADQGPVRAVFEENGRAFAVIGYVFYEFFADGTKISRGEVVADTSLATISSSGDAGGELFIVSGGSGYIFTLATNAFSAPVLTNLIMGGYLDGFFLALDHDSTLHISDFLDGQTWDPLQVAQRLTGSDKWTSMVVNSGQIWLIGSESGEVWYNAGTAPFPFALFPNGIFKQGVASSFCVAPLGQTTLAWVQRNSEGAGMVVRTNGFTLDRISTHAVDFAIQGYSDITDAQALSYQDQGHEFLVLSFPTANATWVYDTATQLWHERGEWSSVQNRFNIYAVNTHHYAFGKHLVGSRTNGTIYQMSTSLYTGIDGNGIVRERTAPILEADNKWIYTPTLELDVEVGDGLSTGQGSDPQITMQKSGDGGRTWGNERSRGLGKAGQYTTRVRWLKCGRARWPVFRVRVSDPVPVSLFGAYLPGMFVAES